MPLNLDFSAYIADRTRGFVGREWVFAEIDRWLADEKPLATSSSLARARHRQNSHGCPTNARL